MTAPEGPGADLGAWLDRAAKPKRWWTRISAANWTPGEVLFTGSTWARIIEVGSLEPDASRFSGSSRVALLEEVFRAPRGPP